MKKPLFLLLCLLSNISIYSQSIDSSFTTNGYVPSGGALSNWKQNAYPGNNLVVQPDGKLVVAEDYTNGNQSNLNFYTYRYNANGTPDMSFGTNGVSEIFCGDQSNNMDLILQPDGKIIVVGTTEYCILGVCGALQFVMMRLKTDGSLDSSFGNSGKLITTDIFGNTGLFAFARNIKLLSNGKFIIGGRGPGAYPFVARLNSNGFPDNTFGINGIYTDSVIRTSFKSMAVNASGEAYVLLDQYHYTNGTGADTNNLFDNYIFKLTVNGTRDNSFGTNGRFFFDFSNSEHPASIALRANNSIIVAGDYQYNNTENYNWNGTGSNGYGVTNRGYIAFINANGTIATNIPNGVKTITIPSDTTTFINKVIVLNTNRIMICGSTMKLVNNAYQEKAFMAQVDDNGNMINDFHGVGYWVFDYGNSGTSGWLGKACSFNDLDITGNNEVFATGYRNTTAGSSATSLFLLKLKNVNGNFNPLMVSGLSEENTLSVFPNPTSGYFSILAKRETSCTIYTSDGRNIGNWKMKPGQNQIQLPASVATGIYLLIDEESGKVLRLIKE